MKLTELFLMLIIYSFIGWAIEVFQSFLKHKKFVNRGFLIGPICPIYGNGAVLITLLLTKYQDSPLVLFILAMVICAILEYFTSYLMEKLFNARWWDYHHFKYNINGRICLETMVPFGLLGLVVIYVTNPLIDKLFNFLGSSLPVLSIIILIIYIIDNIVSFKVINNFKKRAIKFLNQDNTEEVNKKVKERLDEITKLINTRLAQSFPDVGRRLEEIRDDMSKDEKILLRVKKIFKK